jgi:hypothetical protein
LQSASELQLVLQLVALALHWYAPQELGTPGAQVPAPLQVGTGLNAPFAQAATPQVVPEAHLRQAPAPSQLPSCPQDVVGSAAQPFRTSVPDTAGAHSPTVPTPLQVMHVPVQALWQQTPSTQKPLWQSPVAAHSVPFAFCATQTPPEQKLPVVQSVFEVHDVAHAVAPQM